MQSQENTDRSNGAIILVALQIFLLRFCSKLQSFCYKVAEDMTALSFETSLCTHQPIRRYTIDEDSSNSLPWSESLKISIFFSVSRFIRTFILYCTSFLHVVLCFCILCSSLLFPLLPFLYFYISLSHSTQSYTVSCRMGNEQPIMKTELETCVGSNHDLFERPAQPSEVGKLYIISEQKYSQYLLQKALYFFI